MDAVLLDTDVFSFLSKPRDSRGEFYRPFVKGKIIALSFISVGELYVWTIRRKWSASRIAALERHLQDLVVVPYDLELCREYGKVKASLLPGRVVSANDLWIATSAIRHSIPLLTHNRKHFDGIPRLKIVSAEGYSPGRPSVGPTGSIL
jgi:tRNA(fMet)-specific endonuclease VapC